MAKMQISITIYHTRPGDYPMMNLASLVVLIFDQNHLTCRLFTEILIQKCF